MQESGLHWSVYSPPAQHQVPQLETVRSVILTIPSFVNPQCVDYLGGWCVSECIEGVDFVISGIVDVPLVCHAVLIDSSLYHPISVPSDIRDLHGRLQGRTKRGGADIEQRDKQSLGDDCTPQYYGADEAQESDGVLHRDCLVVPG